MAAAGKSSSKDASKSTTFGVEKLDLTDLKYLVVGTEKKRIPVHACFLARSSKFLRAACKTVWSHGDSIALSEEKPETVEAYLQWLYTGTLFFLPADQLELSFSTAKPNYSAGQAFENLAAQFKLGMFLLDTKYCNAIVDKIQEYEHRARIVSAPHLLNRFYNDLPANSTLLRLVLDQIVYALKADSLKEHIEEGLYEKKVLQAMFQEAFPSARSGNKPIPPADAERCKYHDHDEENPKCSGPKPWRTGGQFVWVPHT